MMEDKEGMFATVEEAIAFASKMAKESGGVVWLQEKEDEAPIVVDNPNKETH